MSVAPKISGSLYKYRKVASLALVPQDRSSAHSKLFGDGAVRRAGAALTAVVERCEIEGGSQINYQKY